MAYRDIHLDSEQLHAELPTGSSGSQKCYIQLESSKGLFKEMLFTHPPMKLVYRAHRGNFKPTEPKKSALTIKTLIRDCIGDQGRNTTARYNLPHVGLIGGNSILLLARTVDEITGYEMLEILDSELEALDKKLFLQPEE